MRLSNKQKAALEKITGKPWNHWHPEAVRAYFTWSDRGDDSLLRKLLGSSWESICIPIWKGKANQVQLDLFELILSHKSHAHTVECWKSDFKAGRLFLSDFEGSPDAYFKHASEVYREAFGAIPQASVAQR